jgi:hypothetical protein
MIRNGSPFYFIITINNSSLYRAIRFIKTFHNSGWAGGTAERATSLVKKLAVYYFCILDTVSQARPSVLLQYFRG